MRLPVFYTFTIYIYKRCEKKEDFVRNITKLEKLEYVLRNLQYEKWNNNVNGFGVYMFINQLSEDIAKHEDIIEYFSVTNYENILNGINMPMDIRQRLKEQHIKAKIIKHKKWDYNIFQTLEKQSRCGKIQYLLYIAGLWDNVFDAGNICVLESYMPIAEEYFMITDTDIEWRKLFAIGGNSNAQTKHLLDADSINNNTAQLWKTNCYWDNEVYFWIDTQEPNKKKLDIVKRTYDLINTYKITGTTLLKHVQSKMTQDDSYNECWLKYAILREYEKLLTQEISASNGNIQILIGNFYKKRVRFMPYVLLLDKACNIIEKDYIDLNPLVSDNLGGFYRPTIIASASGTITFEKGTYYESSDKKWRHRDDYQKYNMRLHGDVIVSIPRHPDMDFVFTYKSGIYTIYKYTGNINKFEIYKADIPKTDIEKIEMKMKKMIKGIVQEFDEGYYDLALNIQKDTVQCWKHDGGGRRSWRYEESVVATLKLIDDCYTLN